MESPLLLATNVLSLFVDRAMSTKEERVIKLALSAKLDTSELKVCMFCCFMRTSEDARLSTSDTLHLFNIYGFDSGSPRVEGDEEEDDIDDIEHEFDYGVGSLGRQGSGRVPSVYGGSGHTGSYENATSSRQDSSTPGIEIPLLTYGEEVNIYPFKPLI